MNPTIISCLTLIGIIALDFALRSLLLFCGLRWAKASEFSIRSVIITTLALYIAGIAITAVVASIEPRTEILALAFELVGLGSFVFISCMTVQLVFQLTFLRSVQAWILTLLASVASTLVVIFLTNPFLFEGYRTSGNDMAPTLLVDHYRDTCPICGKSSFCSALDRWSFGRRPRGIPMKMICENFHVDEFNDVVTKIYPGDKFLVAKYLTPNRWDIVAYQSPEFPEIDLLGRIVGLPGEEVVIKNGSVWVDGTKLSPPLELDGIQYSDQHPNWGQVIWGSENRPAELGKEDYFVLGDYSENSYDSRVFETGASGHQPFAVPAENVRGVVSHIYWPFSRWRAFR